MRISRREFLRVAAAAAAVGRLAPAALANLQDSLLEGGPRVIWLQGAGCDGCAVSFLNSIHHASVDDLLVNTLDVEFQSNLMAVAGDLAVSAANAAGAEPGYILIVEGAIPTGANGRYCVLWPGMTMHDGLVSFAENAAFILAIGACASYGGMSGGEPNPTNAGGVGDIASMGAPGTGGASGAPIGGTSVPPTGISGAPGTDVLGPAWPCNSCLTPWTHSSCSIASTIWRMASGASMALPPGWFW